MTHRCGKYWLGERLAVGGMAEVYLATARGEFGFARRVVVKRLLPHLAERPEVVQLFLDEARLLARLHHPRVVQVLDLGSADGQSYQALEYLDGLDVATLRAPGPLAPELALRIVAAVAEGLAYVHGAKGDDGENLGIVHGDVAPGNVVVTRAGEVSCSTSALRAGTSGRMRRAVARRASWRPRWRPAQRPTSAAISTGSESCSSTWRILRSSLPSRVRCWAR